jgi:hypothetical protein
VGEGLSTMSVVFLWGTISNSLSLGIHHPDDSDSFSVGQDLGNSNYSIHLPRTSFDRNETAQVVVRALQNLGVDGRVNERNDICVGTNKIGFYLFGHG